MAIDLVGFGIVAPILPLYAKRFGASGFQAGLLFASFSLAQFVMAPVMGRVSDRIGRKPVIIVSLLGTAIGSFLTAAAGGLALLFVARIVDGASGASVSVAQGAVTDLASPADRPRLLGMLGAAFGVGFVIGPAIGGLAHFNARLPFVIAGVIALVNAAAALVRLPETHGPRANRTVGPSDLRADFLAPDDADTARRRRRSLLLMAAAGFLATAAFAGFESTFSLFGARRFHLTLGSTALVFVAIGVALVIVQGGVVGRVTAAVGPRRAYVGGVAVCGMGLAVLAGATAWAVLVVALGLLVVGQGIASPTLTSLVVDRARPDRRGEALGVQQSAGSLARIAGPAAAGLLFDRAGVAWPYVVGAVLMALVVGLVVSERA